MTPETEQARVLIVDDDPTVRIVLSTILEGDFEMYQAPGLSQALQVLEQHAIDVVVTDFLMLHGSGLELLEWLRQGPSTTVGILLTGRANQPEIWEAQQRHQGHRGEMVL